MTRRLAGLPSWRERAACRPGSGARPQDFSPEDARGRVRLDEARRTARDWCAGCPVVDACLSWANDAKLEGVIAGGRWLPLASAADTTPINLLTDDEEWKVLDWLDDEDYEVSSHGRVRTWKAGQGKRAAAPRLLSQFRSGYKHLYVAVGLFPQRKRRTVEVQVLVARAFIGPRPDGMEVRHLDGDHRNNHVNNLAYGTPVENAADTKRHGRHAKLNNKTCPSGHEFTFINTYINPQGARECRICNRAALTRHKAKRRAQRNSGTGAAA